MENSRNNDKEAALVAEINRSLRSPVMYLFVSGAVWLGLSLLFGFISVFKQYNPDFMTGSAWSTYGRVMAAHQATLIFGWGCQTAFAMAIWLLAQLNGRKCRNRGTIFTGGLVWNLSVLTGVVGILAGGGTGMPWMEMPAFAWPALLLSYVIIMAGPLAQFRLRARREIEVAQMYLVAGLAWFPWILGTACLLLFGYSGSPLGAAGVNAWFHSALLLLFFAPIAIGAGYYLVTRLTGKSEQLPGISKMAFWLLAVVAPWAGLQKLTGVPIPSFMPYLSAFAVILFVVPAFIVGINLLKTAFENYQQVDESPVLRFTVWGLLLLLIYSGLSAFLSLPGIHGMTQFTVAGYGTDLLALLGMFGMSAFGAMYFIVPRVTMREWLSARLIKWHFFPGLYAVIGLAVVAFLGGLLEGESQESLAVWEDVTGIVFSISVFLIILMLLLLFSALVSLFHLLLMWMGLGRRTQQATLLLGHEATDPHGPDGIIDVSGPMVH